MLSNKAIIISQPWQKCALVLQTESWVYTRIYTCHFFICLTHWPSRDKCAKHLQEAIQIAKQASIQSKYLEILNTRLESLANGWKHSNGLRNWITVWEGPTLKLAVSAIQTIFPGSLCVLVFVVVVWMLFSTSAFHTSVSSSEPSWWIFLQIYTVT